MIITENLEDGRIRYVSDSGFYLRQLETGVLYEDACHNLPVLFTYEETDELIPILEEPEEIG